MTITRIKLDNSVKFNTVGSNPTRDQLLEISSTAKAKRILFRKTIAEKTENFRLGVPLKDLMVSIKKGFLPLSDESIDETPQQAIKRQEATLEFILTK